MRYNKSNEFPFEAVGGKESLIVSRFYFSFTLFSEIENKCKEPMMLGLQLFSSFLTVGFSFVSLNLNAEAVCYECSSNAKCFS